MRNSGYRLEWPVNAVGKLPFRKEAVRHLNSHGSMSHPLAVKGANENTPKRGEDFSTGDETMVN